MVKVTIEGEPKEIAALIFAVSERQTDEVIEATIQREKGKLAKALTDLNERAEIAFHAQLEQLQQS